MNTKEEVKLFLSFSTVPVASMNGTPSLLTKIGINEVDKRHALVDKRGESAEGLDIPRR